MSGDVKTDYSTPKNPHTILVAEDNADSRQLLCSILRREGYKVIEAENGKEAVSEAVRARPHLIVMDLAMPEMDGIEAARRILERSDISIFAVSAFAISDVKKDVLSAGCKELLEKPIDIEVLLRKIKDELRDTPLDQGVPEQQRQYTYPREVERIPTSIPATWGLTPECPHVGKITSLSIRGCLLETALVVPLSGKPIFVRFRLPTASWLSLQGKALYYLRRVGFGLGFTELTEKSSDALKQLVEHYSKNQ